VITACDQTMGANPKAYAAARPLSQDGFTPREAWYRITIV
jgi:hypothetical protein